MIRFVARLRIVKSMGSSFRSSLLRKALENAEGISSRRPVRPSSEKHGWAASGRRSPKKSRRAAEKRRVSACLDICNAAAVRLALTARCAQFSVRKQWSLLLLKNTERWWRFKGRKWDRLRSVKRLES